MGSKRVLRRPTNEWQTDKYRTELPRATNAHKTEGILEEQENLFQSKKDATHQSEKRSKKGLPK